MKQRYSVRAEHKTNLRPGNYAPARCTWLTANFFVFLGCLPGAYEVVLPQMQIVGQTGSHSRDIVEAVLQRMHIHRESVHSS